MACQPIIFTVGDVFLCAERKPQELVDEAFTSHSAGLRKHKPLVLVIDDEELIADTICQILNKTGFDAFPAYNGKTAVQLATERCPDIVISDVIMPGMDGVATATALLEECPSVKLAAAGYSGQHHHFPTRNP